MSKPQGNRESGAGFTLLELLIVIMCMAVVAGGALILCGDTDAHVQQSLVLKEIRDVRDAILRFREDTGFLPKTGPFAWQTAQGISKAGQSQAWFESPANLVQLFEQPLDASGKPILPWNVDTGRGWRGPYLRQDGEGYVDIAGDLAGDGAGSPVGSGGTPLPRVPAVADPFEHPPIGEYLRWTLDKQIHAGLKKPTPFALARHGRPYLLFDIDVPDTARIVSCGPDGRYDSRIPDVQLDNIVLYLFR